ncbi:hypothetical protein [Streptomyces sp. NPDC002994]|uniref:hypothetical protein n=1 Tax=Streptomyces sp. NPDC002994 TaxID=3154441 RepID=UPI0033B8AA21
MTYRAEGDAIEQGDGWFTLWADEMVIALRLPEADIRSIRAVVDAWEDENPPPADACRPGCCIDNDSLAPTTCAFCGSSEACINHPGQEALARGAAGHLFSPSGQGEESSAGSDSPALANLVRDALGIDVTNPGVGETPDWPTILTTACRELLKSEAARAKLRTQGNIQGRCPACHGQSLFLGDGGYVTCSRIDCQDPDAASVVLENRPRPAGGR